MLSVIDIIRGLSELIEEKFPNYPVNDRDLGEGFPRPSYFIDVDNIIGEMVTANHAKETAELQVYFFAKNQHRGFLELLDMKNELLILLAEPLALKDDGEVLAHVVFNDVSVEISKADMALRCDMTSELIQGLPEKDVDLPYIDNLVYGTRVNE